MNPYIYSLDRSVALTLRRSWFDLGKSIRHNNQSNFQDHKKYTHNDIVKPFRVRIFQYAGRIHKMNNLAKYVPPPSMKGKEYVEADWAVCGKEFYEHDICVATR